MSDEARFLDVLPVTADVTTQVCRRNHLSGAQADDFRSDASMP